MIRMGCLAGLVLVAKTLCADDAVLSDSIHYEHIQLRAAHSQSIHTVMVDPAKVSIELVKAGGLCTGADTISAIAHQENALLAINGGYCCGKGAFYGVPAGALKIGQHWYADTVFKEPIRACLSWNSSDQKPLVEALAVRTFIMCNGEKVVVDRLNQERSDAGVVVYTPVFGHATLAGADGVECVVQNGVIVDVRIGKCSAKIPQDGFVISIGKNAYGTMALFSLGASVTLSTECVVEAGVKPATEVKDFIVGAAPRLVVGGEAVIDFTHERVGKNFAEERHPRTAVGVLKNGYWLFVVVDGYQVGVADGMTLPDLAQFMKQQGCVEAVNLSGGVSSTMWFDGAVKNNPGRAVFGVKVSFEKEVSDALIVSKK